MQEELIRIEHLSKTFNGAAGKITALDNINITINQGDIFGIIGLSGAGTSTLVRCINLLETPTEGNVIFGGRDLMRMERKELLKTRRSIGMIFQDFNLMAQRSAIKNVCYPMELVHTPRAAAEKRAMELLELVGLANRAKAYPSQLSGGQKQRVAIARALATTPEIIYFDEPTSALDPELTGEVLAVMRDLANEGMTMLVVTHEMSFARNVSNRVMLMENGVIVEAGESKAFFEHPQQERTRAFLRTLDNDISHPQHGQA